MMWLFGVLLKGKKEREMCYTPIIKELRRVLPLNPDHHL